MKRSIILLAAAAFLCSGCEKVSERVAERKKKVTAAEETAAKAQARFAARAAEKETGAQVAPGKAGEALASLLCASPKLMEDIEGSLDLQEALGGEGGDRAELKRQALASRDRYRAVIKKELPRRGASYEEFVSYAQGQSAEEKQKFKALVAGKCPRGDKDLVERTAAGLLRYFAGKGQ